MSLARTIQPNKATKTWNQVVGSASTAATDDSDDCVGGTPALPYGCQRTSENPAKLNEHLEQSRAADFALTMRAIETLDSAMENGELDLAHRLLKDTGVAAQPGQIPRGHAVAHAVQVA